MNSSSQDLFGDCYEHTFTRNLIVDSFDEVKGFLECSLIEGGESTGSLTYNNKNLIGLNLTKGDRIRLKTTQEFQVVSRAE